MTAAIVIPARLNSSRFPGKPLFMLADEPLILRTYSAACRSRAAKTVIVAAEDREIIRAMEDFGRAILTSPQCKNGTERVAEAVASARLRQDIIVNLQADEPLIASADIDRIIVRLEVGDADAVTLFYRGQAEQMHDENSVKLVPAPGQDWDSREFLVRWFTRRPVGPDSAPLVHVGVYAFRREYLVEAARMKPTVSERAERLEQLRWIGHGARIVALEASRPTLSLNSPADVPAILAALI